MQPYQPEWARPDSPTRSMSHAEMIAYYKTHDLARSCAFHLRDGGHHLPDDVRAQYAELADQVARARKETSKHRAELARIRTVARVAATTARPIAFGAESFEGRAAAALAEAKYAAAYAGLLAEAPEAIAS